MMDTIYQVKQNTEDIQTIKRENKQTTEKLQAVTKELNLVKEDLRQAKELLSQYMTKISIG